MADIVNPLPITFVAGTLPAGAVYNAQTYFNAIVARMTGTVSSGNIIWGQLGGLEPTGPLPGTPGQEGLWYGNGYWHDWDPTSAKYLPIKLVCGQFTGGALVTTTIACGATANRTITTPDNSGTIALTSDLVSELGTTVLSPTGSSVTVDWSNAAPVYIHMTANLTVNHTNDADGMIMDFWLENASGNSATTYTITFTGAHFATALTLSSGATGKLVIDHVRLYRVNAVLFGELMKANFQV